jgi:hypothetical protein
MAGRAESTERVDDKAAKESGLSRHSREEAPRGNAAATAKPQTARPRQLGGWPSSSLPLESSLLLEDSGLTDDEVQVYVDLLSQPGASTRATHWYRALMVSSTNGRPPTSRRDPNHVHMEHARPRSGTCHNP